LGDKVGGPCSYRDDVEPSAVSETSMLADAVVPELAKPTDAAYEAVRFDEDWTINSRRAPSNAVKAMVCVPTRTLPLQGFLRAAA
jgi:hypothetical protein